MSACTVGGVDMYVGAQVGMKTIGICAHVCVCYLYDVYVYVCVSSRPRVGDSNTYFKRNE